MVRGKNIAPEVVKGVFRLRDEGKGAEDIAATFEHNRWWYYYVIREFDPVTGERWVPEKKVGHEQRT